MEKRCTVCLTVKPLNKFHRDKTGFRSACGQCRVKATNARFERKRKEFRAKYAHVKGI